MATAFRGLAQINNFSVKICTNPWLIFVLANYTGGVDKINRNNKTPFRGPCCGREEEEEKKKEREELLPNCPKDTLFLPHTLYFA